MTVDYATSDGTAVEPDDYTSTSGTLTFTVPETSKTLQVPVVDDTVDEDEEETFTLTLSDVAQAGPGRRRDDAGGDRDDRRRRRSGGGGVVRGGDVCGGPKGGAPVTVTVSLDK